jgi:hypothetical protein
VNTNSDLYIKGKDFKGTRGIWELLTKKCENKKLVNEDDLTQYKNILLVTSIHLEGYEPNAPKHVLRGMKFKTVIAKLFHQTKRRGNRNIEQRVGNISEAMLRSLYFNPSSPSAFTSQQKLQSPVKVRVNRS